jgi:CDR ABC transporter
LFGAKSGSTIVSGKDYIKAGYDLNVDDRWHTDFVVLVVFLFFFWFTQTVVIEIFPVSTEKAMIHLQSILSLSRSNLSGAGVSVSLQRKRPRRRG